MSEDHPPRFFATHTQFQCHLRLNKIIVNLAAHLLAMMEERPVRPKYIIIGNDNRKYMTMAAVAAAGILVR